MLRKSIQHRSIAASAISFGIALLLLGALPGCVVTNTSTTQPSGLSGTNAENDPMGYSPDFSNTSVSGGKINEYNDAAMKHDVNDFLNP